MGCGVIGLSEGRGRVAGRGARFALLRSAAGRLMQRRAQRAQRGRLWKKIRRAAGFARASDIFTTAGCVEKKPAAVRTAKAVGADRRGAKRRRAAK